MDRLFSALKWFRRRLPEQRSTAAAAEVTPAIRIERDTRCLADLDADALRELIADLNTRSQQIGCVIFRPPGDHTHVAIIFAGNLERFFMLAVARELRCPVIYVQDPISCWYQGSDLLPDIDALCRSVILPEVGSARAVLFGQSSGAYAALCACVHLPGAVVVACAPQTFSDSGLKQRIRFVGVRALHAPPGLIDLKSRLTAHPDPQATRVMVIAAGEFENPASAHWWGDYLHLLHLVDTPGIDLFVVNANIHVLVHGHVNQYAELLSKLANSPVSTPLATIEQFFHENYHRDPPVYHPVENGVVEQ